MNDAPAILVMSGAGYIGSRWRRALSAAGYHPVDKAMLARVFAQPNIVAVMHFAASSLVGESVAEPQRY